MFRRFLKDSIIYTIPSIISRGLSLILVPLYTRVLSPADYGALDLLLVFAGLVNLTVAFEVSQGVARYYAAENDVERKIEYASSAFWFTLLSYSIFLGVTFSHSFELSIFILGRDGLEEYFRIGLIYIWLNGIFYLVQNQFRWELRSNKFAIVSIIVSVLTAVLAIFLTYVYECGLAGLLYGMTGGALVGCVYGLWNLRSSFRFRFQWERLKEMLIFSAPLVPSGIAVFISLYIDRLMINHFLSLDEVGLYGIGFRVASIIGMVMIGFQGALTPLIYKHYRDQETPHQLARIFRVFLAFVLLVFTFISLFASEILMLFTTPEYYPAERVVVFLVPSILLSSMYIFAPGIGIAKKTHIILWINIFGALMNAMFNWVLIPLYGISGAAVATLLGYSCVFISYMSFSQKYYYIPHQWRRIAVAVTLIVIPVYSVTRLTQPVELLIELKSSVLFLALLTIVLSGMIRTDEVLRIKQILQRRMSRFYGRLMNRF